MLMNASIRQHEIPLISRMNRFFWCPNQKIDRNGGNPGIPYINRGFHVIIIYHLSMGNFHSHFWLLEGNYIQSAWYCGRNECGWNDCWFWTLLSGVSLEEPFYLLVTWWWFQWWTIAGTLLTSGCQNSKIVEFADDVSAHGLDIEKIWGM